MLACPSCGRDNPPDARFCNSCGAPLGAAPTVRKERKFATALFADLVGSTSLAEHEDPEVVQSVVGRTFDRLATEIGRYEGFLEKFMGDAVLAVFGIPRAHEDDAERAVRVALEMQAVLSELNRGFAAEGKPTLAMRIGIEAGEVLVDVERVSGPRDRMLTGDAVNTAARLEASAEPGQIVVGPAVYASTKDVIEYREMDPLTLKGKAEPVPAWRALRIKAKTRGERPRLGMEARLVGRDEELSLLKQTFQRVQTDGRPALMTVVGPAGVGKSRLVSELEHHVEEMPEIAYWRRGRCLAYANTAYSALADAIKAQCEIFEDDTTEVAAGKVSAAVRDLFGDDSVTPQVSALVGAGEARDLSREELFDAWRRFLERLAARYPLVLVLDDIHWADDGLLDFIDHVSDWAQGPINIVATARAELFEKRPTWGGGKRNATSIYLDPLSPAEGEAMLDDLLPGPIQPELRRTIVERSEGNPLYVEEIVRKLIDDGVLRATQASQWEVARPIAGIDLPRSIQGLIAMRLDGLQDDEKAVLQDAAVVGRVFWLGALVGADRQATGRGARRHRPPARQGARRPARAILVQGRAGVRLPPRAHSRRRLRVATEVAAGRQAPGHRDVGARAGGRPRRRDCRAGRDARGRGGALPGRAWRAAAPDRAAGVRPRVGCRAPHVRHAPGLGEQPLVPRGRAPGGAPRDFAGRARPAGAGAHRGVLGSGPGG